jgi:hypothetical protein
MSLDQEQYNLGTCEAILDTSKTIYNEESERFKQAEAKTNITLAFSGVLFGAYLTYIGAFKPVSESAEYYIYTYLFKLIVFVCFTISITYFLKSIRTGEYDQAGLDAIVNSNFAKEPDAKAKLEIAATYKDALDLNRGKLETKMKTYNQGLNFMFWGFILFALHFVIEEVVKRVN